MELVFEAIQEAQAGPRWQAVFERHWAAYRRWFLSEGNRARPYYLSGLRKLREHMPELLPTYERLTELAGGSDLAARFLALYCPPPYLSGCSQAVWSGSPPLLARNYDYSPLLCEGVILDTRWNGRRVIAMSDCLWGVLDGINEDGLALSLTFGGSRSLGQGFGVPLILRYVLEFCTTAADAAAVLSRVPSHMAYNVTAVDRSGDYRTVFIAPDRPAVVRNVAVATNHQDTVEWHQHARATATLERERFLYSRLRERDGGPERLVQAFLRAPLYSTAYARGFGTVYTAVYHPVHGLAEYIWPNLRWQQSFTHFEEGKRLVRFPYVSGDMHRLH